MKISIAKKLIIEKMEPYDGEGYLCYFFGGANTGYGDTPGDAFNSWERGDDIGEDAAIKWGI